MTKTILPKKFSIDKSDYGISSFEFKVKYNQNGEVNCLYIQPLSIYNICDLLEVASLNYFTVFDVEQFYLLDDKSNRHVELLGLIKDIEIEYNIIDSNTIVLPKTELLPLLSAILHNEFSMFDIIKMSDELQIIGQVIECRDHSWKSDRHLITSLTNSSLFLYGHDDKFLYIESTNQNFIKHVITRGLYIYAGYFFPMPSQLCEISIDLIDQLWLNDFSLMASM